MFEDYGWQTLRSFEIGLPPAFEVPGRILMDGVRLSHNNKLNDVRLRVLRVVERAGGLTRAELAAELDVTVSTVAKAVNDLLHSGLLSEAGIAPSGKGRHAKVIHLTSSAAYAAGLGVAGDVLSGVVINAAGTVLAEAHRQTVVTTDEAAVLGQLLDLVQTCISESSVQKDMILGYGIGLHAPIDSQTGKCAGWPNTPEWSSLWERLSIRDELAAYLGPGVEVGNANRFAALAEQRYGSARGERDFFYVHIGQGVGGAVFLDGKPYESLHGVSGEVGHITVDEDGPRCNCGNAGCLEALISTPAVLHYARTRLEAGRESLLRGMCNDDWSALTVSMIIGAASKGDKFSYEILNRYGEQAGTGIATALNLLGTDLVIVRSEFLGGQDIVLDAIRRSVILRGLPIIARYVRVERATFGILGPALGAATYVIQRALAEPSRIREMYHI